MAVLLLVAFGWTVVSVMVAGLVAALLTGARITEQRSAAALAPTAVVPLPRASVDAALDELSRV